jgi:hypothetical protein
MLIPTKLFTNLSCYIAMIISVNGLSASTAVHHKVLTYIEYRAVSGVFRTIDPPTPSQSPPSECFLPPHQRQGGTHSPGAVRGWGVNISEDARHWIGLLQYDPSTQYIQYSTN